MCKREIQNVTDIYIAKYVKMKNVTYAKNIRTGISSQISSVRKGWENFWDCEKINYTPPPHFPPEDETQVATGQNQFKEVY